MKQTVKTLLLVFLIAAMTVSLLVGCSGNTNTGDANSSAVNSIETQSEAVQNSTTASPVKEKVALSWAHYGDYGPNKANWPNETFKAICKDTNIDLEFIGWPDANAEQIALASGDLPDIITIGKQSTAQVLQGNLMIPMDEYLSRAPHLENLSKLRLAAMREFYSNGDGKLYFWTPYVGSESLNSELWNGTVIRWDYYKELGYPEVKSEDDFLNIVKQAVEKHPQASNGKKVYGVGTHSSWGLWGWMNHACQYGYLNITDSYVIRLSDSEVISNLLNLESPLWRDISYYWKANQLGLFDPDSFIQTGDDLSAKATNGQYISIVCTWWGYGLYDNAKINDPDTMAKFMVLPLEGQYNWANSSPEIGWSSYTGITKNCKNPERAMDLFEYLNSPDGARVALSGAKGIIWDVVDGKAQILPDAIKMRDERVAEPDKWAQIGSTIWPGIVGMSDFSKHPDGGHINVWFDPPLKYAQKELDPVAKDFAAHYGVEVPVEAALKLIDEGKAYDQSKMLYDLYGMMPSAPQEIARIDTKCQEIMTKALPKLVLAKDYKEFTAQRDAVISDLKAAGIDQSVQWYTAKASEIKSWILKNK